MTAADLRAALARLGWTAARLAEECGVTVRTVRNWLADTHRIPKLVERHVASALTAPPP